MQRILVVDDEEKIRVAIQSFLESKGYEVLTAENGSMALEMLQRTSPDLMILDLMMPVLSGEEVCRAVRLRSRLPIILLTAKAEESEILCGFDLGADDYVTKPFSLKQLGARVEAILRRSSEEPEALMKELVFEDGRLVIDFSRHEVRKDGQQIFLTAHELKLLLTLAKQPTKVFTREELILKVLGEDFDGFDRAIDSHVKNIRLKIEDNSKTPKYLITIHGVGYKFGR